jgi:SPFH domain / Band 7 family
MLGIRFIKSQPTTYLMEFKNGKIKREGAGLSLLYHAPSTSMVAVPMGSQLNDFIYTFTTADFQAVTVQGQVTWRIGEPKRAAAMLNFALRPDGKSYESEDPQKLQQLVLKPVEVLTQKAVGQRPLRLALQSADSVASLVRAEMARDAEVAAMGLEILGLAVVAIRPTPETARALEAEARESILKIADDAVFARRNAAVEQERTIRESELDTEVAVEQKRRQIKEAQMDAQASVRRKEAEVTLEERRKAFVAINAQNTRTLAEAEAHKLATVMAALEQADTKVVQALASAGMNPGQLIAQAFGGIAERAEKIGQLNVSPDLLERLLSAAPSGAAPAANRRPA